MTNLSKSLLVEIRTEELPPMQLWELADSFPDTLLAALQKEGFADSESARVQHDKGELKGLNKKLATPRRLAAQLSNISAELPPQDIVRRGPQIAACKDADGTPTKALMGFMQSVGATCEKALTTVTEKGKEYMAWHGKTAARKLADELAAIVERVLLSLPAPRLMRWGANEFKFIRPVRGVLMLHGKQHISGNVMGISATKTTKGHPYMSDGDVEIVDVDSYANVLKAHKVIVDMYERITIIADKIKKLAAPPEEFKYEGSSLTCEFLVLGNEPDLEYCLERYALDNVNSEKAKDNLSPFDCYAVVPRMNDLLREVCAMCEFPSVHRKDLDEKFADLPWQCIMECMQKHQRFLPMVSAKYKTTLPIIFRSIRRRNLLETRPSPLYFIVSDNAPVAPEDQDNMLRHYDAVLHARLSDMLFYYREDKKDSQKVYVEKLKNIIFHKKLGSQHDRIERVCSIASKLTNSTEQENRESAEAFLASLPTQMVGEHPNLQAVMSNEYFNQSKGRMDMFAMFYGLEKIVGLFGVGENPTGSKDPHGLRRDAVAFINMRSSVELTTRECIDAAVQSFAGKMDDVTEDVYNFFLDRLRHKLFTGYSGAREAVLSQKPESFGEAVSKILSLEQFLSAQGSEGLAAANKRINNIFRKSKVDSASLPPFNSGLLSEDAERELFGKLNETKENIKHCRDTEWGIDYSAILQETATLAPAVDAFFDSVLVNHEDEKIRLNRFALLAQLRELLNTVGDLSYLAK